MESMIKQKNDDQIVLWSLNIENKRNNSAFEQKER